MRFFAADGTIEGTEVEKYVFMHLLLKHKPSSLEEFFDILEKQYDVKIIVYSNQSEVKENDKY